MAVLGSLLAVLVCLAVVVVAAAIVAWPVIIVWHLWVKARRAHRAANRPVRQPYDDGFDRELWEQGYANGRRDARLRIEGGT